MKTPAALAALPLLLHTVRGTDSPTRSGLRTWVDPATPANRQVYVSTRGDEWELVMSDEFNTPGRSFEPGADHMWTSINKPDGVNAALEIYSHNMTSTECEGDRCYFYIKAMEDTTTLRLWNDYKNPPGYQSTTFYYRAGMVQSWNKFCFQGGMVEVAAQLPGVVSSGSGNPDLAGGPSGRAATAKYYPTWPGIWMMGNLGRAIFSASTNRMWPFSYDECNEKVFASSNQRISACDANPGHGLNRNQGRGAPEIDILEGAGSEISSSIQLGPGMPTDFRILPPKKPDTYACVYTPEGCVTPGANAPDLPPALYQKLRGHRSWYQGLRYAANNFCASNSKLKQEYKTVKASLDKAFSESVCDGDKCPGANVCDVANCPGSNDVNADVSPIDGSKTAYWGINTNGTCYPKMNGYTGAYLCSPGNPSSACGASDMPPNEKVNTFEYQMDAISSNWPIHLAAYTDFLVYQLEWVMGKNGYVRWMLAGQPIFEIPASAITNPPQDGTKSNPVKVMIEEPMYLIFNVALSSTWGTKPPNPGSACRGDGKDPVANKICDAFPMKMKIDYIRLYQDTSASSKMTVGCDPPTHPTKQWIVDHIAEYQDYDNLAVDVAGKAFCRKDDDCASAKSKVSTGSCVKNRCKCIGSSWTGPRCTSSLGTVDMNDGSGSITSLNIKSSYGPPWYLALGLAGLTIIVTFLAVYLSIRSGQKHDAERKKQTVTQPKNALSFGSASDVGLKENSKENYSTNFV